MKKHHATKKTKPRSFDDIVANQDLQLPSLQYFFGRERGMNELSDYARPHFEKLLLKQRRKAINAINKIKSDIQDQYNKELKDSRNKIAVETTGAFLNALKSQPNENMNKVRGLKDGILLRNRDTGIPLHVLPNQYLFYRGDTKRYFPNNTYKEDTSKKEICNSFQVAIAHRDWARLRPRSQKTT